MPIISGQGGSGAGVLPWTVDLSPTTRPSATVGTWGLVIANTDILCGTFTNSSVAQNDSITYKVVLGAGTWTLQTVMTQGTGSGIATITIGAVSAGTLDSYNASLTRNVIQTLAGIVIPTSNVYDLKFLLATKNASSTGYSWAMSGASLLRTA